MKIFNTSTIREADQYTIVHEPIASIDLMERAAQACFNWIISSFPGEKKFHIFCGTGNNGGDGLAIARLLSDAGIKCQVSIIRSSEKSSPDFTLNEKKLRKKYDATVHEIMHGADFPKIAPGVILIDCLFGTGLSRPVTGLEAECIREINNCGNIILSIDLPSGCYADRYTHPESAVIKARHTLTFQLPKLAFFFSSNESYAGDWHVLDIGLDRSFIEKQITTKNYFTTTDAKRILKPRKKFSHKGTYGHALLVSGSSGKMGAAVLASKACIRSGTGLLTVHSPGSGLTILQTAVPEAMVSVDTNPDYVSAFLNPESYDAIGVGPGIGTNANTWEFLKNIFEKYSKPMVIDADALNLLSLNKDWLNKIPENSILTPHPKEFERLTKKAKHDFDRHELQIQFAKQHQVYVILKGAYTCIVAPDGNAWFNSTGNPGMARGGSGDALTGIILGLLTQAYSPLESALLGVFLHGLAGDEAARINTVHAMTPADLIRCLPAAFKKIS